MVPAREEETFEHQDKIEEGKVRVGDHGLRDVKAHLVEVRTPGAQGKGSESLREEDEQAKKVCDALYVINQKARKRGESCTMGIRASGRVRLVGSWWGVACYVCVACCGFYCSNKSESRLLTHQREPQRMRNLQLRQASPMEPRWGDSEPGGGRGVGDARKDVEDADEAGEVFALGSNQKEAGGRTSPSAVNEEVLRTLGKGGAMSEMEDVVVDNGVKTEMMDVETSEKREGLRDDDAGRGRGSSRSRLGRAADENLLGQTASDE